MTEDDFEHEHADHKADGTEGEWISSEPPVDDFGDDVAAESASVSEGDEHETETAEDGDDLNGAPQKKKFPLAIAAGLAVVVLAGGGFGAYQLLGHSGPQPSALDLAAQNGGGAAPNFTAASPGAAPLKDINAAPAKTPVVTAADIAPKTGYSLPMAVPEADKRPAGAAVPAAASLPVESPSAIDTSTPVATAPAPAAAPVRSPSAEPVLAMAAPAQNAANDERLNALSSRIDDLQKSLGQTVQQLGQINEKLTAMRTNGDTSGAMQADPAMEQRLDKLEQKIDQLAKAKVAQPVRSFEPAPVEKAVPQHHHHHAAGPVASTGFTHYKPAKSARSARATNRWVLRAATADEAWIAKDVNTRALRPVHVGDKVDGIGKVTAIDQVGDVWVVQGSHGTIR